MRADHGRLGGACVFIRILVIVFTYTAGLFATLERNQTPHNHNTASTLTRAGVVVRSSPQENKASEISTTMRISPAKKEGIYMRCCVTVTTVRA